MANDQDFKKHNVRGAVTYSDFTMVAAHKSNNRANMDPKFKKKDEDVAPTAQLLLDQVQLDKFIKMIREQYIPAAKTRGAAGEKRDAFDDKSIAKILKALDEWEKDGESDAPPHLPIKKTYAKTLEIAPWAVATVKFTGTKGRDMELLARVNDEDELKVPDAKLLSFPTLVPVERSVHDLYPGAWAYATLNLSGFFGTTSNFGISAYANTVVFLEDRDRLAGGAGLDEDDIFMDD